MIFKVFFVVWDRVLSCSSITFLLPPVNGLFSSSVIHELITVDKAQQSDLVGAIHNIVLIYHSGSFPSDPTRMHSNTFFVWMLGFVMFVDSSSG